MTDEEQKEARRNGIYGFMEEGACKKERRAANIKHLTGAHLIECCRKGGLCQAASSTRLTLPSKTIV